MTRIVFVCLMFAIGGPVNANEFGASIGRTMTMNSAICNQTRTCNQRTPEQAKELKQIGAEANACIRNALTRSRQDREAIRARTSSISSNTRANLERQSKQTEASAITSCKSRRDARHAELSSRTKRA